MVYAFEKEYLFGNEKRNKFIQKLVHSLDNQNNLILFDWVEKHGKILEPLLRKEGRVLHFIYGNTPGEERERIRHLIENDNITKINLCFGDISFEVDTDEEVPLTDGTFVKANNLTKEHDVSNIWIKTKSYK